MLSQKSLITTQLEEILIDILQKNRVSLLQCLSCNRKLDVWKARFTRSLLQNGN